MVGDHQKIVLIGDGSVGSAYAYSLALHGLAGELAIINHTKQKAVGDAMDLEDATAFTGSLKVYNADYGACSNADVVVICAGVPQKIGESRLQLVTKNCKIIKSITQKVTESGFDGIFIVAANPVDIMTYVVKKYSGFQSNKVIGTGTSLDTARLKIELARKLMVNPQNINIHVMAEHGDSEFVAYSTATVAGKPLLETGISYHELLKLEDKVRNKAYEIISSKGATYYGVATAIMQITRAVLRDESSVLTVGTILNGEYGYKDICIGSPAVINRNGISKVIQLALNDSEESKMQDSVSILKSSMKKLA